MKRPKVPPLFMVGSDGKLYACAPATSLPRDMLAAPGVYYAVRLSTREARVVLAAVQDGVAEASKAVQRLMGGRLDS